MQASGMRFNLIAICVLLTVLGCVTGDDVIEDFPVCPEHRPYAIKQGTRCCTNDSEDWCSMYFILHQACSLVDSDRCENFYTQCVAAPSNNLEVSGFGSIWDGEYTISRETDPDEFLGKGDLVKLGNRAVFNKGDECIWWYRGSRTWWLDKCVYLGQNYGYASKVGGDCPYKTGQYNIWKITHSGNYIFPTIKIGKGTDCGDRECFVGGIVLNESPATAALTSSQLRTSSSNRVTRRCRWRRRNGKWKCISGVLIG